MRKSITLWLTIFVFAQYETATSYPWMDSSNLINYYSSEQIPEYAYGNHPPVVILRYSTPPLSGRFLTEGDILKRESLFSYLDTKIEEMEQRYRIFYDRISKYINSLKAYLNKVTDQEQNQNRGVPAGPEADASNDKETEEVCQTVSQQDESVSETQNRAPANNDDVEKRPAIDVRVNQEDKQATPAPAKENKEEDAIAPTPVDSAEKEASAEPKDRAAASIEKNQDRSEKSEASYGDDEDGSFIDVPQVE